jgi:tetratricopeptide (TPR) repeat protein
VHRSTYVEAVALYEKGVQLLQAHKFKEAAEVLKGVIARFPDEKELHERARLYILVCERSVVAAAPAPAETTEDRVFAATLAINNGQLDQAISQLSAVIQQDPEHDHAAYMLGMAHALRGNVEQAVQFLGRAMALNVENRELVRKEPDLESLRRTDAMMALLASPPALIPRKEKRPGGKINKRG